MTTTYIKLLRKDQVHNGYAYKTGLNELKEGEEWNPAVECGPGGLYVCTREDVVHWLNLYHDLAWFRLTTGIHLWSACVR